MPMRGLWQLFFIGLLVAPASPSYGLCSYHGELYAKTTLSQEFADLRWVVRAKVIAADDHWSDDDVSWTIYRLSVLTAFKGTPPSRISLFTYRDSGGFYLDKGMSNDFGGEYLLFLNPTSIKEKIPAAALGTTMVNYACGQSKLWSEISDVDQTNLTALSRSK
jgi:hypothetical protein